MKIQEKKLMVLAGLFNRNATHTSTNTRQIKHGIQRTSFCGRQLSYSYHLEMLHLIQDPKNLAILVEPVAMQLTPDIAQYNAMIVISGRT